jgi:hypothetical protein
MPRNGEVVMTEAEWNARPGTWPMLEYLWGRHDTRWFGWFRRRRDSDRAKKYEREMRLYACACCRLMQHLLGVQARQRIEVAERYADGQVTLEELRAAAAPYQANNFRELFEDCDASQPELATLGAILPRAVCAAGASCLFAWYSLQSASHNWCPKPSAEQSFLLREQGDLELSTRLRDIIGNPFRPLKARTFPTHVVGLAQSCYEGEHDLYLVLADALEELGESESARHCREPRHAKGCHVLDWILGKRPSA